MCLSEPCCDVLRCSTEQVVERVVLAALYPMEEGRVVSGPGFGLVIGAQTKAAGYVVDFEYALVDIGDMLEEDLIGQISRVNGTYVSILNEALTAWREAKDVHVADLDRYALALISVDEALVVAEEQATEVIIDASVFGCVK